MNQVKRRARRLIIKRANQNRISETLKPYTGRQINQAVQRVRNLNLVAGKTLVEAGFNATGPNHRKPR